MNTIERVSIIDDRVFMKIHFGEEDSTLILRFYVPENKEAFIKQFGIALNRPFLIKPEAEWKELGIEEEFLHGELIQNAIFSLKNDFKKAWLTGVFQKKCLELTGEGRDYFVLYPHRTALTIQYACFFSSFEEALLTFIKSRCTSDKKIYKFMRKEEQRTTCDVIIANTLYSIDRVNDLLLYKVVDASQLKYLVGKRLLQ